MARTATERGHNMLATARCRQEPSLCDRTIVGLPGATALITPKAARHAQGACSSRSLARE